MFRYVPATVAVIAVAILALGSPAKASAAQPTQLWLPWEGGALWTYTYGPHGPDLEALDFQPSDAAGKPCEAFHSSFWVVAAADGVVISLPNAVEIDHGGGFRTAYYHLENQQVKTGDHVQTGDRLGAPGCCPDGDTADGCEATAPHLHFYAVLDGVRQPAVGLDLGGWRVMEDGCLAREGEKSCPLEGGGETGSGGRLVSNSPRQGQIEPSTPADIAVIVDTSAVSGPRETPRQEAALALLQATRPDDRLAVINFNSTARVTTALSPAVVDGAVNADLAGAMGEPDAEGPTNIRLGLVTGCAELLAHGASPAKAAVLLSDGHHDMGSFSGAAECFQQAGIPVFTYAVGSADEPFLQHIAEETGGQFVKLSDVTNPYCEFRRIRAIVSGDPPGRCSTFQLKQNEALTLPFRVPAEQDQAVLEIRWRDRRSAEAAAAEGVPVDAQIQNPRGRLLERPTPGIKYEDDDGAVRYTISSPLSGEWKLVVSLNDEAPVEGLFITFSASTVPQALPFVELTPDSEPEPAALSETATPEPTPSETAEPTPTVTPKSKAPSKKGTPTPAPSATPAPSETPTPAADATPAPTPTPEK